MSMTIDDPRLIESFRAGENEAFEALVRAHRPALYRHALRKLSDHAAAEDAVQETFMRAYKSRARVNDDWQLRPWLHQICANVCIDEANRRRKEVTKTDRWAIVDMPSRGIAPELERELGLDTDHSEMTAAILSLPSAYQEALSMRYVEELEYDEIAQILDISEDNARARVSRASKAVRVLLRPVAAIIAFFAVVFGRRGGKAAMAATVDPSAATTTTSAANHAANFANSAHVFAPLIETAQAVVVQAPAAAPLISKAAIGVSMIVVATSPVTAPVVIDQIRKSPPATVAAPAASTAVPADVAAPVVVDRPDGVAVPAPEAPAPAVSVAPRDNSATGSKGDDPSEPAPGGAPAVGDISSDPSADTDDPSVEPTPTTAPPAVRAGGALSADVTVTPAGARRDLSGSGSLTVNGVATAGSVSGRLSLSGSPDATGRQRLDGTITFTTDDGKVEIRVTGFATPNADDGDVLDISGLFRATGSDSLISSGSLRGSLGSTLALTFSA